MGKALHHILFVGFCCVGSLYVGEACHSQPIGTGINGNKNTPRSKRSITAQEKEGMVEFFSNCMRARGGEKTFNNWTSVVDFVISDTQWYEDNDHMYCLEADDVSCWNYNVDYLIRITSHLNGATKTCIEEYGTRNAFQKKSRNVRSIVSPSDGESPNLDEMGLNMGHLGRLWYLNNIYEQGSYETNYMPTWSPLCGLLPCGDVVSNDGSMYQYENYNNYYHPYTQAPFETITPPLWSAAPSQMPTISSQNGGYRPISTTNRPSFRTQQPFTSTTEPRTVRIPPTRQIVAKTRATTTKTTLATRSTIQPTTTKSFIHHILLYIIRQQNSTIQHDIPHTVSSTHPQTTTVPITKKFYTVQSTEMTTRPTPRTYPATTTTPYRSTWTRGTTTPISRSTISWTSTTRRTFTPPVPTTRQPATTRTPNWQTFMSSTSVPRMNICEKIMQNKFKTCLQGGEQEQSSQRSFLSRSKEDRFANDMFDSDILKFISEHFSDCRAHTFEERMHRKAHLCEQDQENLSSSRGFSLLSRNENKCIKPIMMMKIMKRTSPKMGITKRCDDEMDKIEHPSKECGKTNEKWTRWYNTNQGSTLGDFEFPSRIRASNPDMCDAPSAVEAVVAGTLVPSTQSGDTLTLNPTSGLMCFNNKQSFGRKCHDYKVRFCCLITKKSQG